MKILIEVFLHKMYVYRTYCTGKLGVNIFSFICNVKIKPPAVSKINYLSYSCISIQGAFIKLRPVIYAARCYQQITKIKSLIEKILFSYLLSAFRFYFNKIIKHLFRAGRVE
jgi:hypothetical protein